MSNKILVSKLNCKKGIKNIFQSYTSTCSNLLTQFKTAFKLVESEFRTVDEFIRKYKVNPIFK